MSLKLSLSLFCSLFALHSYSQSALIYPPEQARWDADLLGNQRAVVQVDNNEKNNSITIPWRNRNVTTDQKIIIVDSTSQKQFSPTSYGEISPESGTFQFEAVSGKGIYYIYYLPYELGGRSKYYPDAHYLKEKDRKIIVPDQKTANAKVLRLESVDRFNRNDDMEIIATDAEKEDFLKKHKSKSYLIFPETAQYQIKMQHYLPKRWVTEPIEGKEIIASVDKDQLFPFQIGLFSDQQDLKNIKVSFKNTSGKSGSSLPEESFICFNTNGTSYSGKPLSFSLDVPQNKVQAVWCGIEIPAALPPGEYSGVVTISPENAPPREIKILLTVNNQLAKNKGFDEPWKLTRLSWLNSSLAQENTFIAPYTALKLSDNHSIDILGRQLVLQKNGLPEQIKSFFNEDMLSIGQQGNDILKSGMSFNVKAADGKDINFEATPFEFDKKEEGLYSWKSSSTSEALHLNVNGSLEFDGFIDLNLQLIATKDIDLSDIQFQIPLQAKYAKYFMGLGEKGGKRKENIDWKWDVKNKNQDGGWIGSVNAGIQFSLRDEKYSRPLNTNFYLQKPLILPSSWGNDNKGGIKIKEENGTVVVNNYSGSRKLQTGDTLNFNLHLMITPFHPINPTWQWENRFFHAYKPIEEVKNSGANVINLHHGSIVNPYINYPFIATEEMKSYIDSAHQAGLKVKIYNTVREVSNRLYELYPLRSLGHEVFSAGNGQGYSWLQEHLNEDYIAAWFVPEFKDAAIINSGMNRWHNYYVEEMNWLVDQVGIDGIYLDDVAFDRITMKRIKRVMTKNGHPGIIDLHSANQFNKSDGFNNSANLYLEHFPYINKLWFGEYFDYENNSPDFYLTEVSGIPFGLMGEMLQDGGNPWRGMIYGMTNRYPWEGALDTRDIWRIWDEFGIEKSKMIGYWVEESPVKTNIPTVLTTSYVNSGKTMIALASWAEGDTEVNLNIDWKKLGLNPKKAKLYAPSIKNIQEQRDFKINGTIPVEKGKGWILILAEVK